MERASSEGSLDRARSEGSIHDWKFRVSNLEKIALELLKRVRKLERKSPIESDDIVSDPLDDTVSSFDDINI